MTQGIAPRQRPGTDGFGQDWYDALSVLADDRAVVLNHPHGTILVRAGDAVTTAQMAEMIRLTSGFIQIALPEERCDALLLGEAIPTQRHRNGMTGGQSVAVDAATGISTGISAADRARTARVLADPVTGADDLIRPGHLISVRVRPDDTRSIAALALRLVSSSGSMAAVFAELVPVSDPTGTVGWDEACAIAAELATVAIAV